VNCNLWVCGFFVSDVLPVVGLRENSHFCASVQKNRNSFRHRSRMSATENAEMAFGQLWGGFMGEVKFESMRKKREVAKNDKGREEKEIC